MPNVRFQMKTSKSKVHEKPYTISIECDSVGSKVWVRASMVAMNHFCRQTVCRDMWLKKKSYRADTVIKSNQRKRVERKIKTSDEIDHIQEHSVWRTLGSSGEHFRCATDWRERGTGGEAEHLSRTTHQIVNSLEIGNKALLYLTIDIGIRVDTKI